MYVDSAVNLFHFFVYFFLISLQTLNYSDKSALFKPYVAYWVYAVFGSHYILYAVIHFLLYQWLIYLEDGLLLLLLLLTLVCHIFILSPMYSDSLSLLHNSNQYVHWLVPTVNQTKLLLFALICPSSSKTLRRLVFCSLFKLTILQPLKLSLSNKRKN